MSKKSRKKFLCLDCQKDTGKLKEHYFIHTDLWMSLVGSKNGMLCILCLEKRLGRELNKEDFPDVYINHISFEPKSQLLIRRLSNG